MTYTMLKDPSSFGNHLISGIKNIEKACCGKGWPNAEKACFINYKPNMCLKRKEFLFWDMYHPTEYASRLAAFALFNENSSFVTSINFSQLAQASPIKLVLL